jgi:two-component system, OmpR family, phosphate regulon sensor histidine kinase PhoR
MFRRRSLGWPITLGVVTLLLLVAITVWWIVMTAAQERYGSLAVGATFLALVIIGVVLYLSISIKEIKLNQRQSNFIDSVTHELKSPIASLKLYLQTLRRRQVSEQQQADFYRFMLDDLERLDNLINHMLDAARVEHAPNKDDASIVEVDMATLLRSCAATACQRHRVPPETVSLDLRPAVVRGREIDVDMIFRNLIDNAIKYGGSSDRAAEVEVEMWPDGRGRVITRIADNGPGIPLQLRRKIFGRFVRLGSELEREKIGTGLGLFIVRTLVRRLKGKVYVQGRGGKSGTVFEVDLPGEIAGDTQLRAAEGVAAPAAPDEGKSEAEPVR